MPLDNTAPQQELSNDGSLADAVLHMPDLDIDAPNPEPVRDNGRAQAQPRNPRNGQWTEADAKPRAPAKSELHGRNDPELPDGSTQGDGEAEADGSPVNDEWFELPADKPGEAPRRVKAEEVWQGYQERERLKAEVEEARRAQPPPEAYDQAIYQTVMERDKLMRAMQVYAQALQPQAPDMDLINEESPRYNPGLYQRQMAIAQNQSRQLSAIQQEIAHYEAMQTEQRSALAQAQFAREQQKLHAFWPELRDQKEAVRVRDDLLTHYGKYGITPELIGSVHNAAFYALAKDALAYRRSLQAREAAVKVVRAKPKLVKGQARDGASQKSTAFQTANRRLEQSHSLEDAADALGALL